jgi:uncharacterized protein YjbJ (UPF0337 family)
MLVLCGIFYRWKPDCTVALPLSGLSQALDEEIMDKDRIVESAKQVKGAVKEVVGRAIGDTKLESEGNADKIEGKVQNVIGGFKDTLEGK